MGESYCLYVHTSPCGKKYVGITSKEPEKRWSNGRGYRGSYFSRAIKKYGWENFKHEVVLTGLSKDEAIDAEREYIKTLNTTDRAVGYNISLGGEVPANNIADLEQYRLKQSLSSHNAWCGGKCKTSKHKIAPFNRESKYRKKVFQYDSLGNLVCVHESVCAAASSLGVCKMTVSEACNKTGRTCKGFVLKFENDSFLADGKRGSWQSLPVVQMDIDGNVLNRFDSASLAAKSLGRSTSCTILDACKGRQITAYGYRWSFA